MLRLWSGKKRCTSGVGNWGQVSPFRSVRGVVQKLHHHRSYAGEQKYLGIEVHGSIVIGEDKMEEKTSGMLAFIRWGIEYKSLMSCYSCIRHW